LWKHNQTEDSDQALFGTREWERVRLPLFLCFCLWCGRGRCRCYRVACVGSLAVGLVPLPVRALAGGGAVARGLAVCATKGRLFAADDADAHVEDLVLGPRALGRHNGRIEPLALPRQLDRKELHAWHKRCVLFRIRLACVEP